MENAPSPVCAAKHLVSEGDLRENHHGVEQGDEADEAGASDGASQLIPGVRRTRRSDRNGVAGPTVAARCTGILLSRT